MNLRTPSPLRRWRRGAVASLLLAGAVAAGGCARKTELLVTVKDSESRAPVAGVTVAVAGSPGKGKVTGADGSVGLSLPGKGDALPTLKVDAADSGLVREYALPQSREVARDNLVIGRTTVWLQPPRREESAVAATWRVTSTPESAEVLIDDVPRGLTPADVDSLPVGLVHVVVRKAGYRDYSDSFPLKFGENDPLQADLVPEAAPAPERKPAPVVPAPPRGDGGDTRTYRDLTLQVTAALTARRWDEAEAAADRFAARFPDDPVVASWRSLIHDGRQTDALSDEIALLRRSIRDHLVQGETEDASREIDRLLDRAPGDSEAMGWRRQVEKAKAAPPPSPPAAPTPQDRVRAMVDAYREAMESLDVDRYRALWVKLSPTEESQVRRSFGATRSQTMVVTNVKVEVSGDTAVARFHADVVTVMNVGGSYKSSRDVTLHLARTADGWLIDRIGPG